MLDNLVHDDFNALVVIDQATEELKKVLKSFAFDVDFIEVTTYHKEGLGFIFRFDPLFDDIEEVPKERGTVLSTGVPSSQLAKSRKKTITRLPRGLRTTEDNFRQPILDALIALGGKAPMSKVLDLVEEKMKHILNDYDRQKLPSDPNTIRWRNTAQWCRNAMVQEGLLKANSERGIWELVGK